MAQTTKLIIISFTILLLVAYSIAANILNTEYNSRISEYERKAALYDMKKQQLFRQITSLQTIKIQLFNQIESEILERKKRQKILDSLDSMPTPPKTNQTKPAGASLINVSTQQPQIQTKTQNNALLEKLNKIKQVQSKTNAKSSSKTTRRKTRAS